MNPTCIDKPKCEGIQNPKLFVASYFEATEEAKAKAEWAAYEFFDNPDASLINRLVKLYTEQKLRDSGVEITPKFPYDTILERI